MKDPKFLKKHAKQIGWKAEQLFFHNIFYNDEGDQLPCYVTRVVVHGKIMDKEYLDYFIQQSAEWNKRGILVFSVTERDENNVVFREVASQYEGVSIIECKSRWHGEYKCWMICIPTE